MKKTILLKTPVTVALATKLVKFALEKTQKDFEDYKIQYERENKSMHYIENYQNYDIEEKKNEFFQKKFGVIIGDNRPHLSTFAIEIVLKLKILQKESFITEVVDRIELFIDDENPIEEQDNHELYFIEEHINAAIDTFLKGM
jgi:hypothetical protein